MRNKRTVVPITIAVAACQFLWLTTASRTDAESSKPNKIEKESVLLLGKKSGQNNSTSSARTAAGRPSKSSGRERHKAAGLLREQAATLSESGDWLGASVKLKQALTMLEGDKHDQKYCWTEGQIRGFYLKNLMLLNRFNDAEPVLAKSLEQLDFEMSQQPDKSVMCTEMQFFADCAFDIGEAALKQGNSQLAIKSFDSSLKYRRAVVKAWKPNYGSVRENPKLDVFNSLCELGRAHLEAGDLKGAGGAFKECHSLITAADVASYSFWYSNLADALDLFEKASGGSSSNSTIKLVSPYKFEPGSFQYSEWVRNYQRAERLEREGGTSYFWREEDRDRLHAELLSQTRNFKVSDPRRIITDIQMAKYQRFTKYELKDAEPYFMSALIGLAKYAPTAVDSLDADWQKDMDNHEKTKVLKGEIAVFEKDRNQNGRLKLLYSKLLNAMAATKDYEFTEYYDRVKTQVDPNNPALISLLPMVADRLSLKDRPYDAMIIYRKIVEHNRKSYGPKSRQLKESLEEYARLLQRTNDAEGAQKAQQEAEDI